MVLVRRHLPRQLRKSVGTWPFDYCKAIRQERKGGGLAVTLRKTQDAQATATCVEAGFVVVRVDKARGERAHSFLIVLLSVASGACSGRSNREGPDPIPECQQYEQAFVACTGRKAGIAVQSAAEAKTDADRERLKNLCITNLQRIRVACDRQVP
jgi:hypothetical protein